MFKGTSLERIALVGPIAAGKDTVAGYFRDSHLSRAFATPIKITVGQLRLHGKEAAADYLCSKTDMVDRRILNKILEDTEKIPRIDYKDRPAIQYFGEILRQEVNPLLWIKILTDLIDHYFLDGDEPCQIVTDVRKLLEAYSLIDLGFNLIYVDCPTYDRQRRALERDKIPLKAFYEVEQSPAESEIKSLKRLCKWTVDNPNSVDRSFLSDQINAIKEEALQNK